MKKLTLLLVWGVSLATVAAVSPTLTSTSPAGLQRGTEVELRLNGARLAEAKELLLYEPGVQVLELKEVKDAVVVARLKLAADCPLGEHKVRVRTSGGISDLRTFWVGPFPHLEEKEPNTTRATAQKISLNSTVLGTITNEDVDYFAITAKKGETIAVEVEAMRLGRGMFDPYIAILDADGKLLAKVDDSALFIQDAFATLVAPADGEYLVLVRETSYGGTGSPYRLHVGNFPRPAAVFPPGGRAGESLEVKFLGDAGGEFTQTFSLPQPSRHKFGLFAERKGLSTPSANPVRISEFSNVMEQEPNDTPATATATKLELPVAFNGVISRKGDEDWFRFMAKKGQTFEIGVFARRIRSQLDTVLVLADAAGKAIANNDDAGGADSSLRHTFAADGDYCLKITDHLGNGGKECTYRVEFNSVLPEVTTYIADTARYDTQTRKSIIVARGNRFASLMAVRRNNFSGDLAFAMEGFPSGITMQAEVMPRDQNSWPVVFEAAAAAPVAGKLADLSVKWVNQPAGTAPLKGGIWQNYDLVQDGNNGIYYQTWTDRIAVAVVDELPFKIRFEETKAPLVQYGALDVKVIAERQAGFDEPIRVRMLYNPPGVSTSPEITIGKGETNATYTLNANGNAPLLKWKITMLGAATVAGGTAYVSTQLGEIEVAAPFVLGKIEQASTVVGQPVKVKCVLEQKSPFEGRAEIQLVGLPPGATSQPRFITKDDKEVVFEVVTAANAVKGMHRSLFCSLSVPSGPMTLRQSLASGGALRIDAPRNLVAEAKPVAPAKSGK